MTRKFKHSYTVVTDRICIEPGCNRHLKQNLIDRHPDAVKCWEHWYADQMRKRNRQTERRQPE